MKRAEFLAWVALAGLMVVAGILLVGGWMYGMAAFWAGMMVAIGQAVVVGLAGWGLMLARQRAEMADLPAEKTASGFRMMFGEHAGEGPTAATGASETELKTLDTGFQRLVTTIAALVLVGLAGVISWFVIYGNVAWARANPDKPFPIAGAFDKPIAVDELGLVIGLAAAGIYVALYLMTRVKRETAGYGEAVNSNFAMGLWGMAALGAASVLAYFHVSYASEAAAGIMAALLLLQGLELLVNAMRSYSGIEEFDQEAVDLQAVPLAPMLSSVWLNALKVLGAQSLGLGGGGRGGSEPSVLGRMMPRALAALVVIGIAVSCLRVVRPGEVAVLERLGAKQMSADGKQIALLQPGLHLLMPWPIDQLLRIPTQELQEADVGAELHAPAGQKTVDFEFWMVRGANDNPETDMASQFATGDAGSPQLLETYVKILWRVSDPEKYYNGLSHGDFYEKGKGETLAVRTPDALVQQCAAFAVTRTFAIHSADQIMIGDRTEVQQHCKRILQDKLDAASSGIEVADLTIADLHPPYAFKDQPDYTAADQTKRGPASAYENVVSMREYKETALDYGMTAQIVAINQANGEAAATVSQAQAYQYSTIAKAQGEAARMTSMTEGREGMTADEGALFDRLAKTQTLYSSLKDALAPIQKIVIDPRVKEVQLYQTTNNGPAQLRPPGQ